MRLLGIAASALVLALASPATAQSVGTPSERASSLAAQYVDLLNLERFLEELFVGGQEAIPAWERLEREMFGTAKGESVTSEMPTFVPDLDMEALRPFLDIVERLLAETHARSYSEAQLEAMIAFHASRTGDEILAQRDDFIINMITVMIEMTPEIREALGFAEPVTPPASGALSTTPPTRQMRSGEPQASADRLSGFPGGDEGEPYLSVVPEALRD